MSGDKPREVLTPEELSALLEVVGDGGGSGGSSEGARSFSASAAAAEPYDFRHRSRLTQRELTLLSSAMGRAARGLGPILRSLLRGPTKVGDPACNQRPARLYLRGLPVPSLLFVLDLGGEGETKNQGLLVLDPGFAAALVDRMLGGSGQAGGSGPGVGRAMLALTKRVVNTILAPIEEALSDLLSISLKVTAIETDPYLTRALPPTEPVQAYEFEVDGPDELEGLVRLVLPARILASGMLETSEPNSGPPPAERLLQPDNPVANLPVEVSAVLGELPVTVQTLLDLEVGDVLCLGCHVEEPVEVRVSGEPKFFAKAGLRRGRLVLKLIDHEADRDRMQQGVNTWRISRKMTQLAS